jgi:hypothetical protein
MASSKFNVLTHGLSGLVGDMLVFRQKAGRTIVASKPRPSSKPVTVIALAIRERFKRAASYAASIMANLTLKAEYQQTAKPGQSAYNMAFSDYQKAPEIYEDINLSVYTGAIGEAIEVSVMDDFRVESVSVTIKTAANVLVEEGAAIQSPNGLDWIYTTTAVNAEVPGSKIIFAAKDLPGNETVVEKMVI